MKPGPEIFNMALGELGLSAEQALMVGDTWLDDVEGARSLGIRTLHLRRGETVDESRGEISSLYGVIEFLNHNRTRQLRKK
jgi:putative hydrolase of the HAD superfamily